VVLCQTRLAGEWEAWCVSLPDQSGSRVVASCVSLPDLTGRWSGGIVCFSARPAWQQSGGIVCYAAGSDWQVEWRHCVYSTLLLVFTTTAVVPGTLTIPGCSFYCPGTRSSSATQTPGYSLTGLLAGGGIVCFSARPD